MPPPREPELRFFDPEREFSVVERHLPHWLQSEVVYFITWRTCDSIPAAWLNRWDADRREWLARHGCSLASLSAALRQEYHKLFSRRWEVCLDEAHGGCVLRRPELREFVADSLHHFDNVRYRITDFVVMPNHVHVLAAFPDAGQMLRQCESWKHFTAGRINKALGRSGRFWQVDGFDHLVRGPDHFAKFRDYIARNPSRAGLRADEFTYYTRRIETSEPDKQSHSRSE